VGKAIKAFTDNAETKAKGFINNALDNTRIILGNERGSIGGTVGKSVDNVIDAGAGQVKNGSNTVYRALNAKDAKRLSQGLGLEAKNPVGKWGLDEHITGGSSKMSWQNDPWISTTSDINVAKGFNASGHNLGVVEIDLSKVPSTQLKGWEIYPRVNGETGLPYHYSIWQQETSIFQNIPKEAIRGFVK